ncbi:Uncharacterised protein [Mycobacteroides abscessus subsp. abscessus]|nr:Uncharacterised protein [Mycobacteroides abscessus subsp. abscessus]
MPQIPAIVTTRRLSSTTFAAMINSVTKAKNTDMAGTLARLLKRRSNHLNQCVSFSSSKKKLRKTINKNAPPNAAISG